jgi:glycerol-1-phosphatase
MDHVSRSDDPHRGKGHRPRGGGDRARDGERRRQPDERRPRRDEPARHRDEPTPAAPARPVRPPGAAGPVIPDDVEATELDRSVRGELRSLSRPVADTVARHLAAAGRTLEEDPDTALAHAVAARRLASRLPAVREAVGLAAYHAGQWQTAITELRTYHRISGRHTHLAMVADSERALGRPERAIDIYRTAPLDQLAPDEVTELLIVTAAARAELGQREAALAMLQVPQLTGEPSLATARLRYAYADALLAHGREREAREWFARAVEADADSVTGAAERLLELDGVVLVDAAETEDVDTGETGETGEIGETGETGETGEPAMVSAPVPTGRLVDAYDLVVLDLDGVVHLDGEPVPGAAEAIAQVRPDGPPVLFVTNNASRSHAEVAALLAGLGIEATVEEVLTSATAAAEQLARALPAGAAVLVVGAPALSEAVGSVGLRPVSSADDQPAAVVQGYGPQVGWTQLAEACVAIRAGATWVATNTDATLPTGRGPVPGNGAMVAALRTALGRGPDQVIGKPEPTLFELAARRAGAGRPLVVGDRLDTDIDGAHRAGMDSLLVLTGVDSEQDAYARPPRRRPTYVGDDLTALLRPPAANAS